MVVVLLLLLLSVEEARAERKLAFVNCGPTSKCLSSRQHSTCNKVPICYGLPMIKN